MILLREVSKLRSGCILGQEIKQLFSSQHKVLQIKNNSMMIIEDKQQQLPYMSEVELENGRKGVVLKIEENGSTYVGMYEQVTGLSKQKGSQINIMKASKNWKTSTANLVKKIIETPSQNLAIYDVNSNIVDTITQKKQPINKQQQVFELLNGKKRRLKSSSSILNICHDLYVGDMISFMGCRGSRKSENSWNIAKEFSAISSNSIPIYVNPYMKEVKEFLQYCPKAVSFTVGQSQKPTDAGVYMLTLKAINLSKELKRKGVDVLLIVDNLSDIMMREWSLLQSIKFNAKSVDSSKLFQYNTLKISPVSILNEIYSECEDNNSSMKTGTIESKKRGSLSSILITQNQNNELAQEITTFSNNLKHLQTLSKVIQFPLSYQINTNLFYQKPKSQEEYNQLKEEKGFHQKEIHRFLRSYLNKYLTEKNETELKRQLYKNDIRDAPWDYFFLLDAEWWTTGIKEISSSLKSFKQATQFLRWIVFTIEKDYLGNWNVSAKESYLKFLSYVKNQKGLEGSTSSEDIEFSEQDMEAFVEDAKIEGIMNPFKKDYLA